MKKVLAIILGGGAGTRLYPLTKLRAKPAVPLAGKYRLIDIPVSNCINASVTKIYVLTQFNSASLNRHLSRSYNFSSFSTTRSRQHQLHISLFGVVDNHICNIARYMQFFFPCLGFSAVA